MKPIPNYDSVEPTLPGEYKPLHAGGYVVQIIKATIEVNRNGGQMIVLGYDIVSGEYSGYFTNQFIRKKDKLGNGTKWPAKYYQNIDNVSMFKGLITCIESSNKGYKWDWNEESLKGKLMGGIFRREEYEAPDGKCYWTTKLAYPRSVETIEKGDYEIPNDKPVVNANGKSSTPSENDTNNGKFSEDDIPF